MDVKTYREALEKAEICHAVLEDAAERLRAHQTDHALHIFDYSGKATFHEEDKDLIAAQAEVDLISKDCDDLRLKLGHMTDFFSRYKNASFYLTSLGRAFDQLAGLNLRAEFDKAIVVIENLANELFNVIQDLRAYGTQMKF